MELSSRALGREQHFLGVHLKNRAYLGYTMKIHETPNTPTNHHMSYSHISPWSQTRGPVTGLSASQSPQSWFSPSSICPLEAQRLYLATRSSLVEIGTGTLLAHLANLQNSITHLPFEDWFSESETWVRKRGSQIKKSEEMHPLDLMDILATWNLQRAQLGLGTSIFYVYIRILSSIGRSSIKKSHLGVVIPDDQKNSPNQVLLQ